MSPYAYANYLWCSAEKASGWGLNVLLAHTRLLARNNGGAGLEIGHESHLRVDFLCLGEKDCACPFSVGWVVMKRLVIAAASQALEDVIAKFKRYHAGK